MIIQFCLYYKKMPLILSIQYFNRNSTLNPQEQNPLFSQFFDTSSSWTYGWHSKASAIQSCCQAASDVSDQKQESLDWKVVPQMRRKAYLCSFSCTLSLSQEKLSVTRDSCQNWRGTWQLHLLFPQVGGKFWIISQNIFAILQRIWYHDRIF